MPETAELKVREYDLFRGYYCGVCKAIGKNSSQLSRLTLNYDITFLALLLSSVAGERVRLERNNCFVHPLQKRNMVKQSECVSYAADMNVVLAYYNLKDNWKDEKDIKSLMFSSLLTKSFKKIHSRYKEKCDIISMKLEELSMLEKENCASMDKAAEPFAQLMEELMYYKPLCENNKSIERVLRSIGYFVGKWVYLIDAYDDIEKDIKAENYNPLLLQFEYGDEPVADFKSRIVERLEFNLTYSLNEIGNAYKLIDNRNNEDIIENIIYLGMLRKTENILKGCTENGKKSI